MRKTCTMILLVMTSLGLASCSKMGQESYTIVDDGIQILSTELMGSIPAEYGKLVNVTTSDAYKGWAQLWFEKEDKTIVMVAVNFQDGRMEQKVRIIPRS